MQQSKLRRYVKGVPFVNGWYTKGVHYVSKMVLKGSGVGPQGRHSPYKTLLSTPRDKDWKIKDE